ncbi:hypothetical protein SAMN05446935_1713 [Burkholderia sp. YR290]|nr:hypothetical protein SAMN05446935_1713 [Burkholderia sp. YR290]
MRIDAIGGYFGLELPGASREFHRGMLRFQSARAAFLALLSTLRPSAVWMPWYVCNSVLEPLQMTRIPIRRYELDEHFRVASVDLQPGEWLFYVDYFGLCEENVHDVLTRFPRKQVVIDRSQSFYASPPDCLATLYSPRKFFGVPDGGYLSTRCAVSEPIDADPQSIDRFAHLLKRADGHVESGYADYVAAEDTLSMQEPKLMSALTQRLLESIDYATIREQRARNYVLLDERLGTANGFRFRPASHAAPLCYPFLGAPAHLRNTLMAERIYTPAYWPEVAAMEAAPPFERNIANTALFLPCDQRLAPHQIESISQRILHALR